VVPISGGKISTDLINAAGDIATAALTVTEERKDQVDFCNPVTRVVDCKIERFMLDRSHGYLVDLELLDKKLSEGFDLFVWVNPNNPTGLHIPKSDVEAVLTKSSGCRRT
jgi:histidinol-phosphate/aromatic aminotransferase/cobyric acid decarboxylase-like protein